MDEQDHWLNEISRRAVEKWKQDQEVAQERRTSVATPGASPSISQPATQLKLQLIVWDESHPSAVINGKIVRSGDGVDGATVTQIDRNRVLLQRDGQEVELRF